MRKEIIFIDEDTLTPEELQEKIKTVRICAEATPENKRTLVTLLKRIKENPQISQLPVILLTSKAEVEYKLEGLKDGADAYMAKPFDMEELQIQIDNLIGSVLRLKGKFSGAVSQEGRVENIEVKGND